MRKRCCLCLLICLWGGSLLAVSLPVNISSGKIIELLRTAEAQQFVNQDEALKQGLTIASEAVPEALLIERSPDDGQVFVILQVAVFPARTISPLDYILIVDGKDCQCLGMAARQSDFFDFRYLVANGPAEVKLIFACPAAARLATLKTALELPIPAVAGLVLQEPEPAPEPVPVASTEEGLAVAGSDLPEGSEKAGSGDEPGTVEQPAVPAEVEDKAPLESADKATK